MAAAHRPAARENQTIDGVPLQQRLAKSPAAKARNAMTTRPRARET
jgi:hypothetical protein